MRLHLVSLPHTRVEPDFSWCAYTGKVLKFCKMLGDRHEIILYAPEGKPVPGATLIQCLSDHARLAIFGKDDTNRLPSWPTDIQSRIFNLTAAAKIAERAEERDIVLLMGGLTHKPIFDALPQMLHCEPFVGYEGIFTNKCAFESYAWMHSMYMKWAIHDIRWYDTVIPPFCDPDEFPILNDGKGEYLLFLGRLISRKGPHIALEIAKAAGMPLYVAGAGGRWQYEKDDKKSLVGQDLTLSGDNLEWVGPVNVEERAKLLSGARALIVPTTYAEPGGNVAIEAMLAGTPVIAPDWGVFSETVKHGISGFHFRLLREAVESVHLCGNMDHEAIRQYAIERYSLAAIAPKFDHWFNRLSTLFEKGWYAE